MWKCLASFGTDAARTFPATRKFSRASVNDYAQVKSFQLLIHAWVMTKVWEMWRLRTRPSCVIRVTTHNYRLFFKPLVCRLIKAHLTRYNHSVVSTFYFLIQIWSVGPSHSLHRATNDPCFTSGLHPWFVVERKTKKSYRKFSVYLRKDIRLKIILVITYLYNYFFYNWF